jgi:pimeloyl-ACP methyl ester carboxylesterase
MADGWVGHASLQAGLVRWHSHGAPEVPVRVVAGTARVGRRGTDRRWSTVQRDLAARLGDPAPVLLADAAHLVPLDRPDAVVHAIGRLLRAGAAGEAAGQSSGEHLEAR